MALTGESETYRQEFQVLRTTVTRGETFDQLVEYKMNLYPQAVPGGWKVPVITAWSVELDLDDKSDDGFDVVGAGGECTRRFFIRPGKDRFIPPVSGSRFDNDFIMEMSETNTWFPALVGVGSTALPQWPDRYGEAANAIWIVKRCNLGWWAKQTHSIDPTLSGYNMPEGDIRYSIVYHWRYCSTKEFEARRARI